MVLEKTPDLHLKKHKGHKCTEHGGAYRAKGGTQVLVESVLRKWLVDILFGIDIFINFISAYEDRNANKMIFDRKKIAVNYIKSWFILDLIACFPF